MLRDSEVSAALLRKAAQAVCLGRRMAEERRQWYVLGALEMLRMAAWDMELVPCYLRLSKSVRRLLRIGEWRTE